MQTSRFQTSPSPQQVLRALEVLGASAPARIRDYFVVTPPVEPTTALADLGRATSAVIEGLNTMRDDICGGDLLEMARLCRAEPEEHELVLLQPWQDWATIARPDVVTSGGKRVVVEVNGDSPAGLFSLHDALAEVQARLLSDLGIAVGAEPPHAVQTLVDMLPLTRGKDRVAVCYWRYEIDDAPPAWSYGSFVKALNQLGIDAFHCPLEDLEIHGGDVTHHGEPVTVVYRYFESPAPELVTERRLLRTLYELARADQLLVFTGYGGEILASKLALSLLSDDTLLAQMPSDLASRLREHVPWTRVLEATESKYFGDAISLPDFVLSEKNRMLIKPVRGHAGLGITVGAEVDATEWRKAVDTGLSARSGQSLAVVQEVYKPDVSSVQFSSATGEVTSVTTESVDGVFILDSTPTAVLRRFAVNPGATVNINPRSGYAPSPVWWEGLSRKVK